MGWQPGNFGGCAAEMPRSFWHRAAARFSPSIRMCMGRARRSRWLKRLGGAYDHARAPRLHARRRFSPTVAACSRRRARRAGVPMIVHRRRDSLPCIMICSGTRRHRTRSLDRQKRVDFFLIGDSEPTLRASTAASKATPLALRTAGLAAHACRASRRTARAARGIAGRIFEHFDKALKTAQFPVFVFSGDAADGLAS